MCIEDSSLANAISLCFVFSIVRTFFFIGKGWFYLEFFPKEHFGALYLISNIPAGVANFVVDPIYDGKKKTSIQLIDQLEDASHFTEIQIKH